MIIIIIIYTCIFIFIYSRSQFKDIKKLNDTIQKRSRELEESLKNANIEIVSLKAKSAQDAAKSKAEMYYT